VGPKQRADNVPLRARLAEVEALLAASRAP
jgi:hypothetical protein